MNRIQVHSGGGVVYWFFVDGSYRRAWEDTGYGGSLDNSYIIQRNTGGDR